jgi:hypothetical protein
VSDGTAYSVLRRMSLHSPEPLQTGPPVTPEPVDGPDLVQAAAPEATPLRPPPESELVEAGRLTMGQLAQAHRDRLETGKPVLDVIVERGWVPAEEVAELRAAHGIAPPAPVEVPPVEAAAEPASEEQPVPPPPAARAFTIAIRLTNGDLVTAGQTDDGDKAIALGHAVVTDLQQANAWPFFGGRYLNPDTIVSVDLLPS